MNKKINFFKMITLGTFLLSGVNLVQANPLTQQNLLEIRNSIDNVAPEFEEYSKKAQRDCHSGQSVHVYDGFYSQEKSVNMLNNIMSLYSDDIFNYCVEIVKKCNVNNIYKALSSYYNDQNRSQNCIRLFFEGGSFKGMNKLFDSYGPQNNLLHSVFSFVVAHSLMYNDGELLYRIMDEDMTGGCLNGKRNRLMNEVVYSYRRNDYIGSYNLEEFAKFINYIKQYENIDSKKLENELANRRNKGYMFNLGTDSENLEAYMNASLKAYEQGDKNQLIKIYDEIRARYANKIKDQKRFGELAIDHSIDVIFTNNLLDLIAYLQN